jgi:hypothetical protein
MSFMYTLMGELPVLAGAFQAIFMGFFEGGSRMGKIRHIRV